MPVVAAAAAREQIADSTVSAVVVAGQLLMRHLFQLQRALSK